MIFESHIFKPIPKRAKEDRAYILSIMAIILVLVLIYVFLFSGVLAVLILGGIGYSIIQIKVNENKKKGANRFGSLVERFSLTNDQIIIGDKQFNVNELTDLEIDADDFLDKSNDFFSTSAGTDNFIASTHEGVGYSYQFQIKRRSDLKLVNEIYKEIKK